MTRPGQTVYFARQIDVERGPVKVGCSHWPEGRLNQLAVWSPVPLEIAASFAGGFKEERRLHDAFWADHSHHEWFRWSAELQAVIDSVRDGSFAIDNLPRGGERPKRRSPLANRQLSDKHRFSISKAHLARNLRKTGLVLTDAAARRIHSLYLAKGPVEDRIAEMKAIGSERRNVQRSRWAA